MPKSRQPSARTTAEMKSPVERVRDTADAMFRAAVECCHQHDRVSRIHAKSSIEEEIKASQRLCNASDEVLRDMATAYETVSADVHPSGRDDGWWRRANALWLASREYLRRNGGCEEESSLKGGDHGPDRLGKLHTEFELEASALLALQHAADAYRQDRPAAS